MKGAARADHALLVLASPLPSPSPSPLLFPKVELDVLTGDMHVLRSDLVMDVGNPINPAIDIGQVSGVLGDKCLSALLCTRQCAHCTARLPPAPPP